MAPMSMKFELGRDLCTVHSVVKVGGNAWERRSQARKLCNAAFPDPIEGLFQWERTFLGPKTSHTCFSLMIMVFMLKK